MCDPFNNALQDPPSDPFRQLIHLPADAGDMSPPEPSGHKPEYPLASSSLGGCFRWCADQTTGDTTTISRISCDWDQGSYTSLVI